MLLLLFFIISKQALGFGLCARYILPPLMSLIGVPQLAAALFPVKEETTFSISDKIYSKDINTIGSKDENQRERTVGYSFVSKIFAKLLMHLDVSRETLSSEDRPITSSLKALNVSVDIIGDVPHFDIANDVDVIPDTADLSTLEGDSLIEYKYVSSHFSQL